MTHAMRLIADGRRTLRVPGTRRRNERCYTYRANEWRFWSRRVFEPLS